jgi:hypothetical protein
MDSPSLAASTVDPCTDTYSVMQMVLSSLSPQNCVVDMLEMYSITNASI